MPNDTENTAFIAFGVSVSNDAIDQFLDLMEADEDVRRELVPYVFMADENHGQEGFFGVSGPETAAGYYTSMQGNVIQVADIERFLDVAKRYNVPVEKFGYYLVNRSL